MKTLHATGHGQGGKKSKSFLQPTGLSWRHLPVCCPHLLPIIPALTWFLPWRPPCSPSPPGTVPQGLCSGRSMDLEFSLQPSHGQLAAPGLSPPCPHDVNGSPCITHHPAQFLFLLITAPFQLAELPWLWSVPSTPTALQKLPCSRQEQGPPSAHSLVSSAPRHRAQHEAEDQCLHHEGPNLPSYR